MVGIYFLVYDLRITIIPILKFMLFLYIQVLLHLLQFFLLTASQFPTGLVLLVHVDWTFIFLIISLQLKVIALFSLKKRNPPMKLVLIWKIVKLKQLLLLLLLRPLVVMRLVVMYWVQATSLFQTQKNLEVQILIAYQRVLIFFIAAIFVGSLTFLFLLVFLSSFC